MAGVDTAFNLLEVACKVYQKLCRFQEDREDVSYLAVRLSILIGIIDHHDFLKKDQKNSSNKGIAGQKMILQQIARAVHGAGSFIDDFMKTGRMKRILKAGYWTNRCHKISIELNDLICALGLSSDLHQLKVLGEIQQAICEQRLKSGKKAGPTKDLKVLQHELTKAAQSDSIVKATARIPLQKVHQSVVCSVGDFRKNTASTMPMVSVSNCLTGESVAATATIGVNTSNGLSPRIQELFESPKYASMLLDKTHLTYQVEIDDPSGAFGVIHKGSYLGQPVAVKKLLTKTPSAKAIEEVLEEALLMKTYNFMKSFASVYGVCVLDQTPVIIMERMDTDLFQYIHSHDHVDVTESLDWKLCGALLVARAVDTLHKLKILHRDLKTPNILVKGRNAEELRISDFGMATLRKEISTFRSSQTTNKLQLGEHETIGSYPWMAPEIMQAGKYTEKADVYSLGVILWELFTVEAPWKHALSIRAIESAVVSGKRLALKNNSMPTAVRTLLKNIWSEDPTVRPSASKVVSEIETIVEISETKDHQAKNESLAEIGPTTRETLSSTRKSCTKRNQKMIATNSQSTLNSYLRASKNGDVEASFNLGLLYSQGRCGAPKDYTKAAEYYQAAANKGSSKSQTNLALLYYEGTGVPQDLSLAARYFQLAANQGDVIAQRNLGALYQGGYGVLKDLQLAKRYYSMAANQGDDTAIQRLNSLYQKGQPALKSIGNNVDRNTNDPHHTKKTTSSNPLMKSRYWS